MMKIMIRCVKYLLIFLFILIGYQVYDYQTLTTEASLLKTKWKNSGEVMVNGKQCSDIYILTEVEIPKRHQQWDVEYYYGDIILKVYQNDANDWCRYSSKGHYSEEFMQSLK